MLKLRRDRRTKSFCFPTWMLKQKQETLEYLCFNTFCQWNEIIYCFGHALNIIISYFIPWYQRCHKQEVIYCTLWSSGISSSGIPPHPLSTRRLSHSPHAQSTCAGSGCGALRSDPEKIRVKEILLNTCCLNQVWHTLGSQS